METDLVARIPDSDLASPRRQATNVSLDAALIGEAKRLGINVSRACEQGLKALIAEERTRRWRAENAEAIAESNAVVERNGLPLAHMRQF
jgi:antitoxin CcdA